MKQEFDVAAMLGMVVEGLLEAAELVADEAALVSDFLSDETTAVAEFLIAEAKRIEAAFCQARLMQEFYLRCGIDWK